MTLLNIHIKESEKKKIQKYVNDHSEKGMSDFARTILEEKIKIEESIESLSSEEEPEIPSYIPKDKYVIFVKGAVVAVGDSPSDLADEAFQKFPNYPFIIKYNGNKPSHMDYVYMTMLEWHAWKYGKFDGVSYPLIPLEIMIKEKAKTISACLDTAASLCVIQEGLIPKKDQILSRTGQISTATGIVEKSIYIISVKILDTEFKVEYINVSIPNTFPFKFLIGRNLLDQLDAYLLGKKQTLLIKSASE